MIIYFRFNNYFYEIRLSILNIYLLMKLKVTYKTKYSFESYEMSINFQFMTLAQIFLD